MIKRNWKLLKQDSSGGFNAKLKALSEAEKKEMRERDFKKEEEADKIKQAKAKPGQFSRELTKKLLLEKKEQEGFFITPSLNTKITLMVMEENVEKGLERVAEVNRHLEWQRSLIEDIQKLPKGDKMIQSLRDKAKTASPEALESLLVKIAKNLKEAEKK